MKIKMIFERGGDSYTLPINPEELEINTPGNNEKSNVVGLGEIVTPRKPGLSTFSIDSFIDAGDDAEEFVEFVEDWRASKKPADFTITGLNIDMLVVVEDFTHVRRSGEEKRLYYTLSLVEYRPHGAKIITPAQASTETTTVTPSADERVDNSPAVPVTYTVVSGDSLWVISARFGGAGGANWRELYNLNKAAIGNNPDRIYPGQVYTLPEGWRT